MFRRRRLPQADRLEGFRTQAIEKARQYYRRIADLREENYVERGFQIGDLVLRHVENRASKLHPRWDGPFLIHQMLENGTVYLATPNGYLLANPINIHRIRRYVGNATAESLWYSSAATLRADAEAARKRPAAARRTNGTAPAVEASASRNTRAGSTSTHPPFPAGPSRRSTRLRQKQPRASG